MALSFEKTKPKGSAFRKWYQQNKERLSAKRKKSYAETPIPSARIGDQQKA